MSIPFSRLAAYMQRLPAFVRDNAFETTESGNLDPSAPPQSGEPQVRIPATVEDALLVTARNERTGRYALLLDIDQGFELVRSSSGNAHLYFDARMTKEQHDAVILALRDAGIVQHAWADSAIASENGAVLRPPWVRKGDKDKTLRQLEEK